MKYVYPPMAWTFIGPNIFIFIKPKIFFDLLLFHVKGVLIILPNKQDSQVSHDS
jgi:hypothetical protein